MAWALYTYLGLDSRILADAEALAEQQRPDAELPVRGNVVVLSQGRALNRYGREVLRRQPSEFKFGTHSSETGGEFVLAGRRTFDEEGTGLMFVHGSEHLFVHGTDTKGLEKAMRAFPVRTGTPCPEWMIIGGDAETKSFGGLLGAGSYLEIVRLLSVMLPIFSRLFSAKDSTYQVLPTTSHSNDKTQQSQNGHTGPHSPPTSLKDVLTSRLVRRSGPFFLALFILLAFHGVKTYLERQRYHGLPDYKEIRAYEKRLPQHKMNLPWPEGKNG
ncbi:hypothetical protein FRC00_014142, partial [Tulasnella sp. 408]